MLRSYSTVYGAYKGGNATVKSDVVTWSSPPAGALASGTGNGVYSQSFSATSSLGNTISYAVETGTIPPGLTFAGNTLSGTLTNPSATTTYNFTIRASDGGSYTDQAYSVTVNAATNQDPYSANVLFLYHADGNYNDTSTNARTLVATNPNAYCQVSTADPKFGTGSLYFGGSSMSANSDIRVPASSALALTGDFTFEFQMQTVGTPPVNSVAFVTAYAAQGSTVQTEPANVVSIYAQSANTSNHMAVKFTPNGTPITGTTNVNDGVWRHIAIVRSGTATGNITLYVNGTAEATGTYTGTADFGSAYGYIIGQWVGEVASTYYSGYLDEIRLTSAARYTANFTPPTAAFPYP